MLDRHLAIPIALHRKMSITVALQARMAPLPEADPGCTLIRQDDGDITTVPNTKDLAYKFGASKLVPAQRGAIPNGPAAFSVHPTSTQDLRWLTRCVAQRTAGNVPVKGPGGIEYFQEANALGTVSVEKE